MAQVPYAGGVSDVQPDARPPDDYQRIDASPSAFGGAIAQGAEKAGTGAVDLSKFWGQVKTDSVGSGWFKEYRARVDQFQALNGQDRLAGQAALNSDLGAITDKYRNQLDTADQQLQFENQTRPYRERYFGSQISEAALQAGRTVADDTANNSNADAHTMAATAGLTGNEALLGVARAKSLDSQKKLLQHAGMENDPDSQSRAIQTGNLVYKTFAETLAASGPGGATKAMAFVQRPNIQKALGANYAPLYDSLRARASDEKVQAGAKAAADGALSTTFSPAQTQGATQPVSANALHVGDSIATGTAAAQYGAGWASNPNVTAKVGANPTQVLGQLQSVAAKTPNAFAGRDIVLSTGTSNLQADGAWSRTAFDGAGVQTIRKQLDALKQGGADMSRVRVLGVGPSAGGDYANNRLQAIAAGAGAKFSAIPAGEYDASGVHTSGSGYAKLLGGSAPANATPGQGGFAPGSFESALGRTFKEEGGYNARDANGAPVNFGINQAAHPEVNVANLTREQAAQIYKRDYWDKIDGDNIAKSNPALAHVAFDSAVVAGPGRAREWIAQSGGDAGKFMDLRSAYLNHLVAADPATYAKYARVWERRDNDLRADIGMRPEGTAPELGGQPVSSSALAGEPGLAPAAGNAPSSTAPPAQAADYKADDTLPKPPAPPPEETPEDKLARLEEAKSTAIAKLIQEHPDWNDAELDKGARLVQAQFAMYTAAVNEDVRQRKAREDAASDDVLGVARKESVTAAYQKLNEYMLDQKHPITEKQFDTLNEVLEKRSGNPNPVSFGRKYTEALSNVVDPKDPAQRITDPREILRMEAAGDLTETGANRLIHAMTVMKKSASEMGMQQRINGVMKCANNYLDKSINEPFMKVADIEGENLMNLNFTQQFYGGLDSWVDSGKNAADYPLFDRKKLDETLRILRPRDKIDQFNMSATAAQPDAPGAPLPPPPSDVNAEGWKGLMSMVKPNASGVVNHGDWARHLQMLADNPEKMAPLWDKAKSQVGTILPAAKALQMMGIPYAPPPGDREEITPQETAAMVAREHKTAYWEEHRHLFESLGKVANAPNWLLEKMGVHISEPSLGGKPWDQPQGGEK